MGRGHVATAPICVTRSPRSPGLFWALAKLAVCEDGSGSVGPESTGQARREPI